MSLDLDMERDVLSACLRNVDFLRMAQPVLAAHAFVGPQMPWIWEALSASFTTTGELPGPAHWAGWMDRDFTDAGKRELAQAILVNLWKRHAKAPRTSLEEIRGLVRVAAIRRGLTEAADSLKTGDVDAASAAMVSGVDEERAASMLKEAVGFGSFEDRLRRYEEPAATVVKVRTPLEALDRFTGGGLGAGDLGLIAALTGVGKTSLAVDFGFRALMSGAVVAHITTEETEEEAGVRYDSRLTGIPRDRLNPRLMTPADSAAFRSAHRPVTEMMNRLLVYQLQMESSVGAVTSLAHQARRRYPKRPLVLIVDSADHLRPVARVENFRLGATATYNTLKAIVSDPKLAPCVGWLTTQSPKAVEGRNVTAMSAVSESVDKARVASVILSLTENSGGLLADGTRLMDVNLLKNRLGGIKRFTIYVKAALATCTFVESGGEEVHESET